MHLLKTCSYRLNTEPVGIGILKSKRAVKLFCGSIVFYHLKISVAGASFFALIEKTGTDLTGISSAAIIFTHMNGIDTDVVAIQDSKTCGNDLAVFCFQTETELAGFVRVNLKLGVGDGFIVSLHLPCRSFRLAKK